MNPATAYVQSVQSAINAARDFEFAGDGAGVGTDYESLKNAKLRAACEISSVLANNVTMAGAAARAIPDGAALIIDLRAAVGQMAQDNGVGRVDEIQALCDRVEALTYAVVDSDDGDGAATPRTTTEELMKAELAANLHEVSGFTAKQWHVRIRKSTTAVKNTDTWQSLQLLRADAKAKKATDRHQKTKGG